MSYCDPTWTSDYTYRGVFDAWSWVSNPFGTAAPSQPSASAWVVAGSFDQTDHWQVGPAHLQAVAQSGLAGSGPLRLEVVNAAGNVLRSQSFSSVNISIDLLHTGYYQQGFRVVLPVTPSAAGFRILRDNQLLYQRLVSGPAPRLATTAQAALAAAGTRLSWSLAAGPADETYTIRLSRDGGQTWQVLAVDQAAASIDLPLGQKGGAPTLIEVQASDGVRTDTRTYAVPAP